MIDRWLDLPDWMTILVLLLGYSGTAALCVGLSFLPMFRPAALRYQGIVAPFFVSCGALFGLMTAFLGSAVYDTVRTANQSVMQEREAAIQIIDLARVRDDTPSIARLPGLTQAYVKAVLEHEWNLAEHRFSSPEAERAYGALLDAIADPEIGRLGGNAVQAALLRTAQEIGSARVVRLTLRSPRADQFRWIGVLLLGVLTQFSIAAVHLDRIRPQILALLLSTGAIVVSLGVIAVTERPFDGALAVSAEPLIQVIDGRL